MKKFKFYIPTTSVMKGKSGGRDVYYVEGLASDGTKDADGETMAECEFDTSELKFFNYNHEKGPENIIGVPTEWKAKKGSLYVKGELYSDIPKAKDVIHLMEALEKNGNKQRLGISVEGSVLERDPVRPEKIKRAKILALAICPFPKNNSTYINLMEKGIKSDCFLSQKSIFTHYFSKGGIMSIDEDFNMLFCE